MAATIACVSIVHLPAHEAWQYEAFDRHQFVKARSKPVEAHVTGDGWTSNGLGFDDITRMGVVSHTTTRKRQEEPPLEIFSREKFARLIVELWERRTYWQHVYAEREMHFNLTLRQRLDKAQDYLLTVVMPAKLMRLDRLCREWQSCVEPEKRKLIAQNVKTLDGEIRAIKSGPGLIARILYLSWHVGLDSVAVSEIVHYSSVFVRQQLHRARLAVGIDLDEVIRVRKMNEAKRRLARAETKLAALLASKDALIAERIQRAQRTYEQRWAKAMADLTAKRERVLALAVGVL